MRKLFLVSFILLFNFAFSQDQNIIIKEGLYYINGDLFTGTFTQTNEEGIVTAKLKIKNGKPHGKSEYYFLNGEVLEIRNFRKGLKHGTWLKYNEENVIISLAKYKRDKKHGNWKIWDDNGNLRYSLHYKNGEKTGTWEMWDENGNLISSKTY
ncbi:MAG: toxin-antitoxin system YwqK family antitoxin [Bacteroidales bacterium]